MLRELEIGGWGIASDVAEWIEIVAVAAIGIATIIAVAAAVRTLIRVSPNAAYETFKHVIGKGLLLALDLLIAGDIIRTVTLEPTLNNVAALGLLVLVRTFLAWSLVVEIENRWPWQVPRRVGAESLGR